MKLQVLILGIMIAILLWVILDMIIKIFQEQGLTKQAPCDTIETDKRKGKTK